MSFFDSIRSAFSGAVSSVSGAVSGVKDKMTGAPVPITETAPVAPPLTVTAGRRRRSMKTRKGVKRRATRKNVSRK
jgi:hypothetical protein